MKTAGIILMVLLLMACGSTSEPSTSPNKQVMAPTGDAERVKELEQRVAILEMERRLAELEALQPAPTPTSDIRAKETIRAGLSEARGTMEARGSLLANITSPGRAATVTRFRFQVANAAAGEPIDLTPGRTVIKYTDINQTVNFDTSAEFSATVIGSGDSDTLLETGEVFEILIPPTGTTLESLLTPDLSTNTQFTLEVIPPTGATLYIQRSTPLSMEALHDLN